MLTLSPDKLSLLLLRRKPIQLSLLECLWPARRGISSPVSTVLGTGAFFASTSLEDPRTLPELALFCTCKQIIIDCKY